MSHRNDPPADNSNDSFPLEIEFYIEPDGTVTFADLAADILPVAQALNPDQPLACDVPSRPEHDVALSEQAGEGQDDA